MPRAPPLTCLIPDSLVLQDAEGSPLLAQRSSSGAEMEEVSSGESPHPLPGAQRAGSAPPRSLGLGSMDQCGWCPNTPLCSLLPHSADNNPGDFLGKEKPLVQQEEPEAEGSEGMAGEEEEELPAVTVPALPPVEPDDVHLQRPEPDMHLALPEPALGKGLAESALADGELRSQNWAWRSIQGGLAWDRTSAGLGPAFQPGTNAPIYGAWCWHRCQSTARGWLGAQVPANLPVLVLSPPAVENLRHLLLRSLLPCRDLEPEDDLTPTPSVIGGAVQPWDTALPGQDPPVEPTGQEGKICPASGGTGPEPGDWLDGGVTEETCPAELQEAEMSPGAEGQSGLKVVRKGRPGG